MWTEGPESYEFVSVAGENTMYHARTNVWKPFIHKSLERGIPTFHLPLEITATRLGLILSQVSGMFAWTVISMFTNTLPR